MDRDKEKKFEEKLEERKLGEQKNGKSFRDDKKLNKIYWIVTIAIVVIYILGTILSTMYLGTDSLLSKYSLTFVIILLLLRQLIFAYLNKIYLKSWQKSDLIVIALWIVTVLFAIWFYKK